MVDINPPPLPRLARTHIRVMLPYFVRAAVRVGTKTYEIPESQIQAYFEVCPIEKAYTPDAIAKHMMDHTWSVPELPGAQVELFDAQGGRIRPPLIGYRYAEDGSLRLVLRLAPEMEDHYSAPAPLHAAARVRKLWKEEEYKKPDEVDADRLNDFLAGFGTLNAAELQALREKMHQQELRSRVSAVNRQVVERKEFATKIAMKNSMYREIIDYLYGEWLRLRTLAAPHPEHTAALQPALEKVQQKLKQYQRRHRAIVRAYASEALPSLRKEKPKAPRKRKRAEKALSARKKTAYIHRPRIAHV